MTSKLRKWLLICFSSIDRLPSGKPPALIKCADDREVTRVYKMAYDRTHGFAVIISNTNFPEEKREGNQKDEDNLSKTFRYLGYTVVIYQDYLIQSHNQHPNLKVMTALSAAFYHMAKRRG